MFSWLCSPQLLKEHSGVGILEGAGGRVGVREEVRGVGGGGWNLAHVGGGDPDAVHWSFTTSPGAKTCSVPEWSWM